MTIITITLIACVAFYVLVLFRTREDASLLTSSIVVAYILYLQWSALASNPDQECNQFLDSNANTTLQIIAGLCFTFISLAVISSSTKDQTGTNNIAAKMNQPLMEEKPENAPEDHVDDEIQVHKKDGHTLT